MTLTKTDIKSAVDSFKKENKQLNLRQALYASQRSDLYQLVIDDINANKGKVSRRRYNKNSINSLPTYSAPLDFNNSKGGLPFLWEADMTKLISSFISAVGYNKKHKVLKVILNTTYVYFYQDVPESAYRTFINSKSPGKYYNRFRKNYAGIRLA